MSLQAHTTRSTAPMPVGKQPVRAGTLATFVDFSHIAWDGHDLEVISKYDVILD